MKKSIYTVFAFAVFAASAFAAQAELDVKIPFEFKAGAATLPAGTYKITQPSPGVVMFRGEKGAVLVPRTVLSSPVDFSKASVTFSHAGGVYVLQPVHAK